MRIPRLIIAIAVLLVPANFCHARIYGLVEANTLDDKEFFGYSGTVTTDGSLGLQTSVDFITSWNIQIVTQGTTDGITVERLTPANSVLSLELDQSAGLEVTEDFFRFAPHQANVSLDTLTWQGPTSGIRFGTRSTNGGVYVFDMDTTIGVNRHDAAIARVVPEPSSMLLGVFTGIALLTWQRTVARQ